MKRIFHDNWQIINSNVSVHIKVPSFRGNGNTYIVHLYLSFLSGITYKSHALFSILIYFGHLSTSIITNLPSLIWCLHSVPLDQWIVKYFGNPTDYLFAFIMTDAMHVLSYMSTADKNLLLKSKDSPLGIHLLILIQYTIWNKAIILWVLGYRKFLVTLFHS